jgi:purine-binding chemotaxis protein CheW
MANTQLVIFKLDDEAFGVDILQVKEIIKPQKAIRVPNTPSFIEGIINLRGEVYGVFNLRKKLQFPEKDIDDITKMMIISVGNMDVSFIVDEVSEILRIDEGQIKEPPELVAGINRKYISAVADIGERSIIILDFQFIMSEAEQEELKTFLQE